MSANFLPAPGRRSARTPADEQRSVGRLLRGVLASLLLGLLPDAAPASEPDPLVSSLLAHVDEAAKRKASLSPAQQKVDTMLRRYAWPEESVHGQAAAPQQPPETPGMPWRKDGRLRVIVKVTGAASTHAATLAAAGLDLEIVNDRFGLVQGWIADDALPALAELEFVQSVSPTWPAEHSAGTVTSEGDGASGADIVRQLGYDGGGVVVGVISDGIDSLAASQASGDLPAVTVPSDPRCRRGSGHEGTAMLEIVHDLAPGAQLLFSEGLSSSLAFIDSVECLRGAGAHVIVDDLAFFTEPFFQDGNVAVTAMDAVAGGVSYHTSAGNFADDQYLVEDYRPGPGDFHDFDPGPDQVTLNLIVVPAGGVLNCRLQWADPFGGSSNDYDLLVVEPVSSTILTSSTNPQTGFQDPQETVLWLNPLSGALVVGLAIPKFSGAGRALKLLCPGPGTPMEYSSSQFGIWGHAARPEVIAVAAIDALDPGLNDVEVFSSRGPAPIFFPVPVARPKPDLAAFDGVTTTAPGFAPFFGTSAAAPHSAAVAALLLSKNPTLSPAEVQDVLTSTAVDIEGAGFDDAAGSGRIDALAAINAVSATTTSTTTIAPTTTTAPTTTSSTPTTQPPTTTTSSTVTSTTSPLPTTTSTTQAPSTSSTTFVPTTTTAPTSSTVTTTTVQAASTLPTTTTVQTSTTVPTTVPAQTTSTTLPACDADNCDGNPCTVGDTCVAGVCQPGDLLTAGRLSGMVGDAVTLAAAECGGDRRKSVKKVVKPLTQAARLLGQANTAANERKLRKKLSQAQRAARQAAQKLGKERTRLSSACVTTLDAAIAGAGTGLSCLP